MSRIVASWQENGMQYTITATPINTNTSNPSNGPITEMLTVFEYLGNKTPEPGIGEKVYKYAVSTSAKIESKEVSTNKYTGKVMMYQRSMLDVFFNKTTTSPVDTTSIIEDDYDLPF